MCEPDKWVRTFSIDETARHKNGFTIYKITSVLFPLASPEAVTIVSVWKRYSDLQKLHRKIKSLHSGLYLKGKIPEFAKWSYFKRFDSEVVEDRKKSIKLLLEFIAEYPPLITSIDFVNFLKNGYPDPLDKSVSNIEAIRSSLQLPVEEPVSLGYPSDEEDTCSTYSRSVSMDDTTSVVSALKNNNLNQIEEIDQTSKTRDIITNICDPVHNSSMDISSPNSHKKTVLKQTSLKSCDSLSSLESGSSCILPYDEIMNMDVDKMSPYKTRINKSKTLPDLISFDMRNEPCSSRRQSDLISEARNSKSTIKPDFNLIKSDNSTVDNFEFDTSSFRRQSADLTRESRNLERLKHDLCSSVKSYSSSDSSLKSQDEPDYGSSNRSLLKAVKEFGKKKDSLHEFRALFLDEYSNASKLEISCQYSTMPRYYSTSRFSRNSKKCDVDCSTDCSYVFEAAQMLNLGARCEDSGNFQKAFDCYKAGIEKMLIGVQDDTDDIRRQFVKEKTTKYLSYAELLYREHLVNSDELIYIEDTTPKSSKSYMNRNVTKNYANGVPVSMLKRPYEDLAKYRVLGIVGGKCMLVLFGEDQQCYVMKVIQKIPQNLTTELDDFYPQPNDTKFPTLPTNVPYMVQLKCYMETNNLIFLILDYASGGNLLDYIDNYVKSVPNTPAKRVNLENVIVEPTHMKKSSKNDSIEGICDTNVSIAIEASENMDVSNHHIYDTSEKENVTRSERKTEYELGNRLVGISISDVANQNLEIDLSVTDIVLNSQRLMHNVDDTLNGTNLKRDSNSTNLEPGSNCTKLKCDSNGTELKHDSNRTKLNCDLNCTELNCDSNCTQLNRDSNCSKLKHDSNCTKLKHDSNSTELNRDSNGEHLERDSNCTNLECHVNGTDNLHVDNKYDTEVIEYGRRNANSDLDDLEYNNDIYSHRRIFLPPSSVKKWSAELLTAVEYLHNSGVVCRDLNPSNLLLAKKGHLTLTYIIGYEGLDVTLSLLAAKNNLTKPNLYVAPEIYSGAHVIWNGDFGDNCLDRVCDFWSYGAILYELITGVPLRAFHPNGFNSHTILQFPDGLDVEIESLLTQLLTFEPKERLGSGPTGIEEIKIHPYFRNIDWKIIYDSWISPD